MTKQMIFDQIVLGLPFLMGVAFLCALCLRVLIWYTVKRHEWFAKEFEKRVNLAIESEVPGGVRDVSFYALTKKFLEKTYFEAFELRDRRKRRRGDGVMAMSDRVFLIKPGCAWLVRDVLKQLKFLKWTQETPKMLNITKATFQHNPCFNRVFGLLPIASFNDVVSVLPGVFVVTGILGTFLGIAKGLPALSQMNLQDADQTKAVMDHFLNDISFAMGSSIAGICFSLVLNMVNTVFNPERSFVSMIERFESTLSLLWYRSDNNDFPIVTNDDSGEALASQSLDLELSKADRTRSLDQLRKSKVS